MNETGARSAGSRSVVGHAHGVEALADVGERVGNGGEEPPAERAVRRALGSVVSDVQAREVGVGGEEEGDARKVADVNDGNLSEAAMSDPLKRRDVRGRTPYFIACAKAGMAMVKGEMRASTWSTKINRSYRMPARLMSTKRSLCCQVGLL